MRGTPCLRDSGGNKERSGRACVDRADALPRLRRLPARPPLRGAGAGGAQAESLHAILTRRYALGEISREQFEEMRQVLGVTLDNTKAFKAGHAHPMSGGG